MEKSLDLYLRNFINNFIVTELNNIAVFTQTFLIRFVDLKTNKTCGKMKTILSNQWIPWWMLSWKTSYPMFQYGSWLWYIYRTLVFWKLTQASSQENLALTSECIYSIEGKVTLLLPSESRRNDAGYFAVEIVISMYRYFFPLYWYTSIRSFNVSMFSIHVWLILSHILIDRYFCYLKFCIDTWVHNVYVSIYIDVQFSCVDSQKYWKCPSLVARKLAYRRTIRFDKLSTSS